jgi:hypothetical protein
MKRFNETINPFVECLSEIVSDISIPEGFTDLRFEENKLSI